MPRFVKKNTNFQLQLLPMDARGIPVADYPTTPASAWQILDEYATEWAVQASSVANGVITLTVTAPNENGSRTLTIRRGGVVQNIYGGNSVYLTSAYRGKLDLTNSVLAWDMILDSDQIQYIEDASGNNRRGSKYTPGNYVNTRLPSGTNYKTITGGPNIPLDYTRIAANLSELNTNNYLTGNTYACGNWVPGDIYPLSNDIDYTAGMPVKTIIGIYYADAGSASPTSNIMQYGWRRATKTGNEGLSVTWYGGIAMYFNAKTSGGGTTLTTISLNDANHLFDFRPAICLIAIRILSIDATGLASIKCNVNRISSTASFQFGTSTMVEDAIRRGISAFGCDGTAYSGATIIGCLDFAAYSDVKSDAFIANMCTAWGL